MRGRRRARSAAAGRMRDAIEGEGSQATFCASAAWAFAAAARTFGCGTGGGCIAPRSRCSSMCYPMSSARSRNVCERVRGAAGVVGGEAARRRALRCAPTSGFLAFYAALKCLVASASLLDCTSKDQFFSTDSTLFLQNKTTSSRRDGDSAASPEREAGRLAACAQLAGP